jgi:5-methylcytosine-specific restriction protein A
MPRKPNTPCKHPSCARLVPYGQKYCDIHRSLHSHDRASATERGYDARWQKARKKFLHSHPLCEECKRGGKFVKATVVDHIIPHRGNKELFWNENNWQALCEHCHNVKTWNEDKNPEYTF